MKRLIAVTFCTLALPGLIMSGCGSSRRTAPGDERPAELFREKVDVEAYLFDAKIRRDGKPTSFRLELFQTDSVIALGGRGYLGKGALKGRLTADSLEVYFPSTDEFVCEPVADLLASFDCLGELPPVNLLSLFQNLPDSVIDDVNATVVSDYSNRKRPKFSVSFDQCPWEINLVYDRRGDRWRIRQFSYSDGDRFLLKATRREYREHARVKAGKFTVSVPHHASRIIP